MHFLDQKTNQVIAADLNISRFRVARLIELALSEGLVSISVATPASVNDELSSELAQKFNLVDALVASSHEQGPDAGGELPAARLTAEYLAQVIEPGAVLGVSWGRATAAVTEALRYVDRLPPCHAVQMVGGMPRLEFSLASTDIVRRLAEHSRNGVAYPLHAPLVVETAAFAETLRKQESVARTLNELTKLDLALVGVGSWKPQSSRLMECLPATELTHLKRQGVVADVSTTLFDANGERIATDFNERTISATWEDLKAARHVIAVAYGKEKIRAIRAVLKANFIHTFITDDSTAKQLLGLTT